MSAFYIYSYNLVYKFITAMQITTTQANLSTTWVLLKY